MSNEQEPPESGPAWAPQDPYAGNPPPGGPPLMGPGGPPPSDDNDDDDDAPGGSGGSASPGGYEWPQPGGPYASPQPGRYESPQPGGYGAEGQPGAYGPQPGYGSQQPGGYGSAQPSGYAGGQQSSGYGTSPPSGYGTTPPPSGYGTTPPSGYGYGGAPQSGSPAAGGYGYGTPQQGSQQDPYGGPPQNPYGAQQQDPYATPGQGPYATPGQGPYGTAQAGSYGAPPPTAPGLGYGAAPGGQGGQGGPASGWMPSYPPSPPARKGNKPLIIGGIVAGAAVLVLVVAVIGMTAGGKDDGKKTPPTVAASNTGAVSASQAAQSLGAVPALRYNGTFSSGGDEFHAQLSVTKAGSATGTITVGATKADLVSVDGNTYLKAPKGFWRDQGGVTTNPEDFAGRWAKAPDSAVTLDLKNVLSAGAVAQGLRGVGSYQPAGGTEDVNGTQAIKVTGADAVYYLSTANPPKLLRIASTGTDTYQFDVTEVSTSEVPTLFQQLRDQVRALADARDPSVRFLPTARIKASNCGPPSCTMKLTVTTLSVGGSGSHFRAVMLGKITAGGRTGRTLGTCSDSASTASGKKINLSCTVRGGAWSSWVRGVRGTASYYVQARTVAESSDAGSLLSAVDQERQGA
jgi:hypothetical protein